MPVSRFVKDQHGGVAPMLVLAAMPTTAEIAGTLAGSADIAIAATARHHGLAIL